MQLSGQPCMLVHFRHSAERRAFMIQDWRSLGLDAVLVVRLLEIIPNRVCFKNDHPIDDFAGTIVSAGQALGERVLSASLIRISELIYNCSENPFACFKDPAIGVLVEVEESGNNLWFKIFYRDLFADSHD